MHVEPENQAICKKLKWAMEQRKNDCPTVPSTIADEKQTNPFMRVCEASVMNHVHQSDPINTMDAIRKEKDCFKS